MVKVSLDFGVFVVGVEGVVEYGLRVVRCMIFWGFRKEFKVDNGFGIVLYRCVDIVVIYWYGLVVVNID